MTAVLQQIFVICGNLARFFGRLTFSCREYHRAPPKSPLAQLAYALRSARIRSVADARDARLSPKVRRALEETRRICRAQDGEMSSGNHRLGLAVYPGSFNPPTLVHIDIARRVAELDGIDAIWVDMTLHRSKKLYIDQVRSNTCLANHSLVSDLLFAFLEGCAVR